MGSVLLHASVIGLVIFLFSPVEFRVYEKVTDVIIASPGEIRIPTTNRLPSHREDASLENISGADQSPGGASDAGSTAEAASDVGLERSIRRGRLPTDKIASLPPELTSEFRLDSPRSEKTGFTLNVTPVESEEPDTQREMTADELDLLSYLRPNPSQTQPLRGNPSRTIRAGVSSRGQPAAKNVVEYDITPWAENAIARIQRNWTIPPARGREDKKAVEISIVVAKSGELLSFEIRNSSGLSHLDMAALKAIELSAPLPALPIDFPLDRLEADLLFQYYE